MSNFTRQDEILIQEYQEAGRACRGNDQLIRTGILIYTAAQAAIVGFIGTKGADKSLELCILEIFGFWLSVVVLLTTLRLHHRYKTYMQRARYIERSMKMNLYQYSFDYFENQKNKIPGWFAGNKKLWATVPILFGIAYVILLIRDATPFVGKLLDLVLSP